MMRCGTTHIENNNTRPPLAKYICYRVNIIDGTFLGTTSYTYLLLLFTHFYQAGWLVVFVSLFIISTLHIGPYKYKEIHVVCSLLQV
uniref:Uncharacterized protein n=1 Tax=Lepeophtheirus salmonis TaxID=72036 RepID=A0A0K2U244_LEPSM